MADFLTTNGTSFHLENIIIDAKKNLVLVSPYLQISRTLFERLRDASARDVRIKIIYGKNQLKPSEMNSLGDLRTLELYFSENLHAKCFFNESKMVITSMNIYEFSEKNNREMGVLIDRQTDSSLFEKASAEVSSIVHSSQFQENKKQTSRSATTSENGKSRHTKVSTKQTIFYCIRCGERGIPYNILKPYCDECYAVWLEYKRSYYPENVCHGCGEFEFTSMDKPLCYDCYKKLEKKTQQNWI